MQKLRKFTPAAEHGDDFEDAQGSPSQLNEEEEEPDDDERDDVQAGYLVALHVG